MIAGQKSVVLLLERYDGRVHKGVAEYAGRHGWHLDAHMVNTTNVPCGWKGDGIITALDRRADLVRFVRRAGVAVVDVSISRPEIRLPRVIGDNGLIGRMAAEHFLERGLRKFGWFSCGGGNVERLRRGGFVEVLEASGFGCVDLAGRRGDWRFRRQLLVKCLVELGKPAGVFAFNDYDAAMVIDACHTGGLAVPDDVAVLGVDNNELVCSCNSIPISSINHDLGRIGYEAASLLDRLMSGGGAPPGPVLIPPRGITVRRSSDTVAVHEPTVRRALLFMRENPGRSLDVKAVVDAAGVSRRTLEGLFRRELQKTVHSEILRSRLVLARDCLLLTGLTVTDIAAKAGFCHPQHLNNCFRRFYGLTPLRYRRKFFLQSESPPEKAGRKS